jgi:transposase
MDTSAEVGTDKLGRRSGPRRQYTIAEKRGIAEQTLQPGASVAVVAQRHGINANLLFGWRRMLKQGLLSEAAPVKSPPLLPAKITTPILLPGKRAAAMGPRGREPSERGCIEIEFAGGQRVRIRGRVERSTLTYVLKALSGR